jgi:branched-chain amino acid transport system permease protein
MSYLIFILSSMTVLIALATLLHLQFGLTGIVNFGVAGFYGVGLYAFGILMVNLGLPFLPALVVATLLVGVIGFVIGWIVLDLDDQAVLVATLSFASIGFYLVTTEKQITKGSVGFGTVPFPFDLGTNTELAFLISLAIPTILLVLYAWRIRSQPYGRLLVGIRDNEGLARSLGKPTFRQKLVLFTVTSALMGFFGAMSAGFHHFLLPTMLGPTITFATWIALTLGGKRHWAGGLVGVVLITVIFDILVETYVPLPPDLVAIIPNLKYLLYGVLLVLVIMFRPEGLLGAAAPRHPKAAPATANPGQPNV